MHGRTNTFPRPATQSRQPLPPRPRPAMYAAAPVRPVANRWPAHAPAGVIAAAEIDHMIRFPERYNIARSTLAAMKENRAPHVFARLEEVKARYA